MLQTADAFKPDDIPALRIRLNLPRFRTPTTHGSDPQEKTRQPQALCEFLLAARPDVGRDF
jgi:hypothetical protein